MTAPDRTPEIPSQYLLSAYASAPRTLIDILNETARRYPDAPAIDDGTVQLTYAELMSDVEESVAWLGARGIGRGDRIGIRMPSGSYALYVAILATLAAGAAYVPVDADDPQERADLVFGEAAVVGIITEHGLVRGPGSSRGWRATAPLSRDDAWIIFTSGSTGTPKGVAVTHRNAAAFVDAEAKMFLQNASPDMVSSQGTAINEALNLAKNFFDDEAQTNRFLFIISDGEDHEENPAKVAKGLVDMGIQTYTIGIGTNKGEPIPIKRNGKFVGYKKDKNDEVVITKLNVETLQGIAENGNGKYILGNKTSKTVEYVEELLVNADKKEFETKQFSDYKDQFQWFLGFGLFFLILDVFLLDKKTKWIQKLNLFNER